MSNRALVAGALVLGYLYIKANGGLPAATKGRAAVQPGSMPASAGSGVQQMATGALQGFLRALAGGVANNTPNTVVPTNVDYVNRSGIVQDVVYDTPTTFDDLVGGDDYSIAWV